MSDSHWICGFQVIFSTHLSSPLHIPSLTAPSRQRAMVWSNGGHLPKWCSPFFTHMVHGWATDLSAHSFVIYKKNIKPSSDRSEAYLCCIPRSQAQTAMRFFALFFCKHCAEAGRSEGSGCDLDCSKKATWLLQPLQIPWPALGFSMVLTKSLRWTQGSQRLSTIVQPSWSAGPSKTWWSDATPPLISGL